MLKDNTFLKWKFHRLANVHPRGPTDQNLVLTKYKKDHSSRKQTTPITRLSEKIQKFDAQSVPMDDTRHAARSHSNNKITTAISHCYSGLL